MNTILLLYLLQPYQHLLKQLHTQESMHAQLSLSHRLTSSYSFITLELLNPNDQLYARISFEIRDTHNNALIDVYCRDTSRLPALHGVIENSKILQVSWNEAATAPVFLSDTIIRYLNIADTIASRAMNCASGDSYRPGFYSTVCVTKEEIVLSQVNHMNAKSLNHKDNYSLRNFDIHIPLQQQELPARYDHHIGTMWMMLNDRSSANNRPCGDALLEQIGIEKAAFEK